MAAHHLHGPPLTYPNPCGLCLSPGGTCEFFLKSSEGSKDGAKAIDMRKSHCPYLKKRRFDLGRASESKESSPSSNIPIECPLCPSKGPNKASAVWKYNMPEHFRTVHPRANWEEYAKLYEIMPAERSWLKKVWNTRLKVKKPYKTKSKELGALSISDAHSATMALRYVSYIQKHL
jgi:hypothetical protein